MLMTGDARHKICSCLPKCQESQQRTVNMTQSARLAHWNCWTETTTHQCGLMSALMDPLMQQSETAGAGSSPTLAVAKHFQGRWLQVRCQATTGPNLLLCMQLPDFSAQTHHPCPTLSSFQASDLLSKATVTQRAAGKRHTVSSL